MPYKRRYKKKRYNRSKQSFSKRVKKVIMKESESKFFDDTATDTSLINTDNLSLDGALDFAGIVAGDSVSQREGSTINCTGMKLNIILTTTVSASIRFLLVSFPVFDAGLDFSPLQNMGVNGFLPRQSEVEGRYHVLWDRTINIDPDSHGSIAIKKYIRYNKKVGYKDGVVQPNSNNVNLYVFTNNTTGSAISITAIGRIMYKDL